MGIILDENGNPVLDEDGNPILDGEPTTITLTTEAPTTYLTSLAPTTILPTTLAPTSLAPTTTPPIPVPPPLDPIVTGEYTAMEAFKGDIVKIMLDTHIDLSGMIVRIKYKKPSGVKGVWTAAINGVDNNIVEYTTFVTTLDTTGTWQIQAYAENLGTGYKGHGRVVDLEVYEPLYG